MPASLHAYAHLEDAWAGGVEVWCREATDLALTAGTRSWLVCATRGQGEWVKSRLLRAGVPLVGLEFLDPSALRRRLCGILQVAAPGTGRELMELLVRWHGRNDPGAIAATETPGQWLKALTELAEAGWLDEARMVRDFVPASLRAYVGSLQDSPLWLPGVDQNLLAAAAHQARSTPPVQRLCLLGFDPSSLPLTNLLLAAIRAADSQRMFVPSPRAGNETLNEAWLSVFESALGTAAEVCASFSDARYDALIRRLEGADLDGEISHAPSFLVAATWKDQIELVADSIASWLDSDTTGLADRLAVVVPERGATSIALSRRLADVGIAHDDTLGERPEPAWSVQLQRAIVTYLLDGTSGGALLRLLAARESVASDGRLLATEATMHRRHEDTQRAEARHLVRGDFSAAVVAALGKWDSDLTVREAHNSWDAAIAALQLPGPRTTEAMTVLAPAWAALETMFSSEDRIPAKMLLEFLDSALASIPAAGSGPGFRTRHARVVITTLREAATQTWNHVIMVDANEGVWPLAPTANRLLPEELREALNARRGHRCPLLTSLDKMRLEESLFLSLLENCAAEFQFASSCHKADSPNLEAHPNEWVLRCLVEAQPAGDAPPDPTGAWTARTASVVLPGGTLPSSEWQHLHDVHAGRRDPAKPFDEYFHNYQSFGTRPQPPPLSARDVEKLEHTPAQLALKLVFEAENRRGATNFARNDRTTIGRLVHRWIELALRRPERTNFTSSVLQEILDTGLVDVRAAHERSLRREFGLAGDQALPGWWLSVLEQSERLARRCLEMLCRSALADGTFTMETERKQTESIATPAGGKLHLTGRFDLLLRDARRVQILDFKSGKNASKIAAAKMLANGSDLQFVAYLWLAMAMDSASAQVGLVTPDVLRADLLGGADADSFRPLLEKYAAMQSNGSFGQSAGVAGRFETCEELPMATVPVPVRTLAKKAALFGWVVTSHPEEGDD
jgi:PD-(D/E)XK nuclease superfamily